jgi:hypothetical protein
MSFWKRLWRQSASVTEAQPRLWLKFAFDNTVITSMAVQRQSLEARAERIAHEQVLNARLARLQAQYERLEQGLNELETEMAIEGSVEELSPVEATAKRTKSRGPYRPRKPR